MCVCAWESRKREGIELRVEKGKVLMGIESLHRERMDEMLLGTDWTEAVDEQRKAIRSL